LFLTVADARDTLLRIDGVDYKFKKGINQAINRRFIGYIAQQVESVVPDAVQLIDGESNRHDVRVPELTTMKQEFFMWTMNR
jgi:hypothetical protein